MTYYLANFLRTLATPVEIGTWSLTSLRERLIKTIGFELAVLPDFDAWDMTIPMYDYRPPLEK